MLEAAVEQLSPQLDNLWGWRDGVRRSRTHRSAVRNRSILLALRTTMMRRQYVAAPDQLALCPLAEIPNTVVGCVRVRHAVHVQRTAAQGVETQMVERQEEGQKGVVTEQKGGGKSNVEQRPFGGKRCCYGTERRREI